VKRALAILFGLSLIPAQSLLPVPAGAAEEPDACASCACAMVTCCVQPAAPESPTPPAAPPTGQTQRDLQLLPAAVPQGGQTRFPAAWRPSYGFSPLDSFASVPLYVRMCALLI